MINRRALLSTAAVGTAGTIAGVAIPSQVSAHELLSFRDQRSLYVSVRAEIVNSTPWDHHNFTKEFMDLPNEEILTDTDRDFLDRIVGFLFGSKIESTTDLMARVDKELQEFEDRLSEIGKAIASTFFGAVDTVVAFFIEREKDHGYENSRQWYIRILQSAVQGLGIGLRFGYVGAIIGVLLGGAMATFT